MLLLSKFKIRGHSMEPQIKDGETILISGVPYWFKKPRIDDIVAFRSKGDKIMVKRILRISNDNYFVQGDNKADSLDSRNFGYVSRNRILGELIYKL